MSNAQLPAEASDIPERLRSLDFGGRMPPSVIEEAAEEIERLRARQLMLETANQLNKETIAAMQSAK